MFGWQFRDMSKQVYVEGTSSLPWDSPTQGRAATPCSHALVEAKKLVKSVFVTSVPCPRSRSCLGN